MRTFTCHDISAPRYDQRFDDTTLDLATAHDGILVQSGRTRESLCEDKIDDSTISDFDRFDNFLHGG